MPPETWLTVSDAAARVSLSVSSVLALIASGDLPASNVSRGSKRPRWRIAPESLTDWLESRRSTPAVRTVRRRRSLASVPQYV